jgi:oligosaccharide repeat unit polymerase
MILSFFVFLFFYLHILFLTYAYFTESPISIDYFNYFMLFNFENSYILSSLIFVILSLLFFIYGFRLNILKNCFCKNNSFITKIYFNNKITYFLFFLTFFIHIFFSSYIYIFGKSNFHLMSDIKQDYQYIGQLRYLFIFFSSLIFYRLFKLESNLIKYLPVILFILIYILFCLLTKTRSEVFEILSILVVPFLLITKDKFNLKFFLVIVLAVIILPNLLVLYRLDENFTLNSLVDNFYKNEYAILLNNFLVYSFYWNVDSNTNFMNNLFLLFIPSPIRIYFELVPNYDVYESYSRLFNNGGGFSGLADIYIHFSYLGLFIFFILGSYLKFLVNNLLINKNEFFIGLLPIFISTFSLFFRNTFLIFIKINVQIILVIIFLYLLSRLYFALFR